MESSIQDIVSRVPSAFIAEKAAGVDATIQAHLDGEKGGEWFATIRDQKIRVEPGLAANPNLTLNADAQDVLDIYHGRLDPMRAFMQGKLRMSGDTSLAMRLIGMFRMP